MEADFLGDEPERALADPVQTQERLAAYQRPGNMGNKAHIGWHPQTQGQLGNHVCHSSATKASATSVDFLKVPGAIRKDSNLNITPEHLTMGQGKWPDFHPWTTDLRFLSGSPLHSQNIAVYVVSGDGTGYSVSAVISKGSSVGEPWAPAPSTT